VARRSLRPAVYATAAAGIFAGGWFARGAFQESSPVAAGQTDPLVALLLPQKGVTIDIRWGDLAKRLVDEGVIDRQKFIAAAQNAGSPLTDDQLSILDGTSNDPLKMDARNAYFEVDVLWALGLANKNAILTEGPMKQLGWEKAGSYASTGGWTLGTKAGPEYLATLDLIQLTPQQQAVVDEVARNSYRPCCDNMTAFPDCNHGMAALALAELMASQGASADDIFQTLKAVSPFWFPTQYHHLATYFQGQGKKWQDVSARDLMGRQYSSKTGFAQVNALIARQGGSGGVPSGNASGCAP